jgi:hypothetical protein
MSPKSRGRAKGRGRAKARRPAQGHHPGQTRQLRLADDLLAEAAGIGPEADPFDVDRWASKWLGLAWAQAPVTVRDAEHQLCRQVVERASRRPAPHALTALAALARVAPQSEQSLLRAVIGPLAQHQPLPRWHDIPMPEPVAAWRAVDVWDSQRALFVEYGPGSTPHLLMALVNHVGGKLLDKLAILPPGSIDRWPEYRQHDDPPMPISPAPAADVLAELASALQRTDMTWPRQDDPDVVALRALTWRRCHAHLGLWPDAKRLDDAQRAELLETFQALPEVTALHAVQDAVAYVASLCLDYGEGYIVTDRLAWNPGHVALFLADWLPHKADLDADDRAALPGVLRAWVRFALTRRGIPERWITPVTAAVDENMPAFTAAIDDSSCWGPARQFAAHLERMGVDPTDQEALDGAIEAFNAQLDQ